MTTALPDIGSLWHYSPWTNPSWQGPWRVVKIAQAENSEFAGLHVFLERCEGPPETWDTQLHEVPVEDSIIGWPGKWEPWPQLEITDFLPED